MKSNHTLVTTISILFALMVISTSSLKAEASSESERLEKLERSVEQLQRRNAQLEAEVKSLKKERSTASSAPAKASGTAKADPGGKSYVEQSVPVEKSSASKWKLSTPITELELYGDARLRYEYRGGESDNDSPLAAAGPGVARHNDWQERDRERYRLRLGLHGTMLDDWFFGVRLETSQNPRSTNVTFGDDTSGSATATFNGPFSKTNDGVYVGQAYVGYRGIPDITLIAGKMPNPLSSTLM